jgi:cytosine/adenosine deaminase-related metal-dependent hydrolase
MRTKVKAQYVIGFDGSDHQIFEPGELVYEGDKILFVGTAFSGEVHRTIDAGKAIVSPGFIDVNALADIDTTVMDYDQPVRSSAGMGWSQAYLDSGPHDLGSPDDELFKSRYALTQLIFNGITTAFPVTGLNYRAWAETGEEFNRIAAMVENLGLRVYLGPSYRSAVYVVGPDGTRTRHWDEELGRRGLQEAVDFIRTHDGAANGLLRGLLVPSTVDTCTTDLLTETRRWSDELAVPVRLHATQSYREFKLIQQDFGLTPAQYLHQIGFLNERTILPHAIYLNGYSRADCGTGPDLDILRDSGLIVAHCPFALARGGAVMESFERFKDYGIQIGMGTDCFPSDMLLNMRLGSMMCRVVEGQAGVATTGDMYRAATLWPADWLGRSDLGRLAVGARPDFFIARLDGFHIGPIDDPIRTLILSGSNTDISMVVINGRTVMENRQIPGVNLAADAARAQSFYALLKQSFSERDYQARAATTLFPPQFTTVKPPAA